MMLAEARSIAATAIGVEGLIPAPTPIKLTEDDLWLFPTNSPTYFQTHNWEQRVEDTPCILVSVKDSTAYEVDWQLAQNLVDQFQAR